MDETEFTRYHSNVKRGDIVGICGYPGNTYHITSFFLFATLGVIRILGYMLPLEGNF